MLHNSNLWKLRLNDQSRTAKAQAPNLKTRATTAQVEEKDQNGKSPSSKKPNYKKLQSIEKTLI